MASAAAWTKRPRGAGVPSSRSFALDFLQQHVKDVFPSPRLEAYPLLAAFGQPASISRLLHAAELAQHLRRSLERVKDFAAAGSAPAFAQAAQRGDLAATKAESASPSVCPTVSLFASGSAATGPGGWYRTPLSWDDHRQRSHRSGSPWPTLGPGVQAPVTCQSQDPATSRAAEVARWHALQQLQVVLFPTPRVTDAANNEIMIREFLDEFKAMARLPDSLGGLILGTATSDAVLQALQTNPKLVLDAVNSLLQARAPAAHVRESMLTFLYMQCNLWDLAKTGDDDDDVDGARFVELKWDGSPSGALRRSRRVLYWLTSLVVQHAATRPDVQPWRLYGPPASVAWCLCKILLQVCHVYRNADAGEVLRLLANPAASAEDGVDDADADDDDGGALDDDDVACFPPSLVEVLEVATFAFPDQLPVRNTVQTWVAPVVQYFPATDDDDRRVQAALDALNVYLTNQTDILPPDTYLAALERMCRETTPLAGAPALDTKDNINALQVFRWTYTFCHMVVNACCRIPKWPWLFSATTAFAPADARQVVTAPPVPYQLIVWRMFQVLHAVNPTLTRLLRALMQVQHLLSADLPKDHDVVMDIDPKENDLADTLGGWVPPLAAAAADSKEETASAEGAPAAADAASAGAWTPVEERFRDVLQLLDTRTAKPLATLVQHLANLGAICDAALNVQPSCVQYTHLHWVLGAKAVTRTKTNVLVGSAATTTEHRLLQVALEQLQTYLSDEGNRVVRQVRLLQDVVSTHQRLLETRDSDNLARTLNALLPSEQMVALREHLDGKGHPALIQDVLCGLLVVQAVTAVPSPPSDPKPPT